MILEGRFREEFFRNFPTRNLSQLNHFPLEYTQTKTRVRHFARTINPQPPQEASPYRILFLKMNGKSKRFKKRRTKVRFEGENTTDSSSTTSAEGITVRPTSYIIAEREEIERIERISATTTASSVSPSLVDLGKF